MPTYRADEVDLQDLKHYGIIRRSGRYPWGSGGDDSPAGAARRASDFFEMVRGLEEKGLSRKEVAEGLGMTTTQLRDATTIAKNAQRKENQLKAEKLRAKGWSASAIGREMGLNESSVRQLLNPSVQERTRILENTVEMLRNEVDNNGVWLDVGKGQEFYVGNGVSKEKLRAAVSILQDEGYKVIPVLVDQGGTNQKTRIKVLCPPGTEYKDVVTSKEKIRGLTTITEDGGRSVLGIKPPMQLSSDRVAINYKDVGPDGKPYKNTEDRLDPESGAASDGVIYVRPGVKDVSIGGSGYAQVRIDVDGTHYLKGMAMYKDDLPDGVDIVFNTNKTKAKSGDDKHAVMKEQSDDKDNPFGAVIRRQITEPDGKGGERVSSVMNILQEEGSWDKWSRTLSSQVLSKQSPKLAHQQLNKTYDKRKREFDEISSLTNPTVREKLLDSFSSAADSDAVHLSAAGMPRSSYHVILPFNSLKDNEVYAPNFNQGERVALIRYPHGGTFEIPELTVNNNAPEPKAAIGRAVDAVGINAKVAERLSGADFDGDFVMVIPNDSGTIKSTPPLRQLEKFDPQEYKLPPEAPKMSARTKGKQMGDVSNLITDMTIQKAPMDEIARAVKHSMVVIDAEKHHLDYKRSAQENGIAALKEKYQGGARAGAATLISKATSQERVNARKTRPTIDPATGKLVWHETGEMRTTTRTLRDGTVVTKTEPVKQVSTKLAETDNAHTLSSGTLIEKVYADHSNRLKALANLSRKEMVNNTDAIPVSPSAKRVYKDEVAQLKNDLKIALMNSPRERQAQVLQNAIVAQKKAANPNMDDATLKKIRSQALAEARTRTGSKKILVPISDRQWEAIQSGAVSKTMLKQILDNADIEKIKELATPRTSLKMDNAATAKAKALASQGLTQAEIARILGMSVTTLKKGLADG